MVQQLSEGVLAKLCDFGTSSVVASKELQRGCCGTMPFVAPEVILAEEYDGFSADVWSLGVLALEHQCGLNVLDRALNFMDP